jgi:Uri superfamily endonuclease
VLHPETIASASDGKGAYLLLMHFGSPAHFTHKRAPHVLDPGWYAYSGSAYGPGGIRARLRRHFQRDKKLHWHVDHLTVIAQQLHAAGFEGGSECAIADRLIQSGAFQPALEGFGSSDCNHCRSHLLKYTAGPLPRDKSPLHAEPGKSRLPSGTLDSTPMKAKLE